MSKSRLSKILVSKYLSIADKDLTTEQEISQLLNTINSLDSKGLISHQGWYAQRIEYIKKNLEKDLATVKRKRVHKEIKLTLSSDLRSALIHDLHGMKFNQSDLDDLEGFAEPETIEINKENVKILLRDLLIPKRKLSSEADLEKFTATYLSKIFGKERVHRQFSVGGFLALKTDLDIGNGQVGVELKVTNKLTATEMQRMIGQIVYYQKRFYGDNLLVLLASRQPVSAVQAELISFMEELGTAVVFNQAGNF